ncbi:hypothetical protein SAMN05216410_1797 [Sanguibacter gelidistatuariae]|uniref:Beta-L-arabinofuranosidase, GH127 n=1 Tax=Sanguibacter gelidistatuariae TaxID=1814289 RepID=A0A1G6LAY6_9MICO|nr:beta-L-arabinofuranosidase domain-containing protein [Sanguibacter gelidistatuariae]SDC39746.1 hypothetical protein SAMN05216410_1797 [Sanguibacter gelidistatuariae]
MSSPERARTLGATTEAPLTHLLHTGADRGLPVAPASGRLRPLGLGEVQITGGFWADLQKLNSSAMIEHCEKWVERMGWTTNFDSVVAGTIAESRRGREFSDSDVYKLMEAMAWEIGRTGDHAMDARFEALVARIAPVQEADGYLSTKFGRPGQQPRYSDLQWGHELYCYGHLIQAGVARGRTTGEDEFVRLAVRAADHVCEAFGTGGIDNVCGHPEIEVALVELSRYTGDRKYRDQAQLFIDRRGHGRLGDIEFGAQYFQDDAPVRDTAIMTGHSVRALYLAAGAADLAVDTGDGELLAAITSQTLATLARRTYLTGGMGAHHEGESFGVDYELPSDRAYSETCAGVASVMLNQRLLLASGEAAHADAVERTLFNVVATSPSQDGTAFYYTNTLHQRVPGTIPDEDEPSARASSSLRAPFFEVSCCPTNVARTVASLGSYLASVDDAGVQLHQFASAQILAPLGDGRTVGLSVETRYPDDGLIRVTVIDVPSEDQGAEWTLSLRVPAWAERAVLRVDGEATSVASGYAQVTRAFAVGDVVELELPVVARWTWPDARVDAVRGQVAVERGPLVLCLESTDLGASVNIASVDTSVPPIELDGAVLVQVTTTEAADVAWPFGAAAETDPLQVTDRGLISLVPYHSWANRGPSTMRVWMPVA